MFVLVCLYLYIQIFCILREKSKQPVLHHRGVRAGLPLAVGCHASQWGVSQQMIVPCITPPQILHKYLHKYFTNTVTSNMSVTWACSVVNALPSRKLICTIPSTNPCCNNANAALQSNKDSLLHSISHTYSLSPTRISTPKSEPLTNVRGIWKSPHAHRKVAISAQKVQFLWRLTLRW